MPCLYEQIHITNILFTCLRVGTWIPVRVKNDDTICAGQIDTQPSNARCQNEQENVLTEGKLFFMK